ncbi:hypothetical protein [Propionicimonas sp.]|uniref:hypothetical protein n=1 Tax=Propionicimonas sp. TaxID=1955623 RepID=UPI0039E6D6D5
MATLLLAGCGAPQPTSGQIGSWNLPVRASDGQDFSWATTGTLREYYTTYGVVREAQVDVTIADTLTSRSGSFSPTVTITSSGGTTETCDSNGGMRNHLYFRPNGGHQVLTSVTFTCTIRQKGSTGAPPPDGATIVIDNG